MRLGKSYTSHSIHGHTFFLCYIPYIYILQNKDIFLFSRVCVGKAIRVVGEFVVVVKRSLCDFYFRTRRSVTKSKICGYSKDVKSF